MDAMQDLYLQKLARWQNFMEVFSLPGWEELPDMDLYVDQVVTLVSRYLNLIPQDEKNPLITASSINNYVRLRVMPAPARKRYGRRHLAYVLMICTLKQSMALTEIQKILPPDLDDEDTKQIYANFVGRINGAHGYPSSPYRRRTGRYPKPAPGCRIWSGRGRIPGSCPCYYVRRY